MSTITNGKLEDYAFLSNMYIDESYPKPLVCRAKAILERLCLHLETNPPADLNEFYKRTHAATSFTFRMDSLRSSVTSSHNFSIAVLIPSNAKTSAETKRMVMYSPIEIWK